MAQLDRGHGRPAEVPGAGATGAARGGRRRSRMRSGRSGSCARGPTESWGSGPTASASSGSPPADTSPRRISTNFAKRPHLCRGRRGATTVSCRPDFTLLIYPAYLTVKDEGDKVAARADDQARTRRPPSSSRRRTTRSVWRRALLLRGPAQGRGSGRDAPLPARAATATACGAPTALVTTWPSRAEEWLALVWASLRPNSAGRRRFQPVISYRGPGPASPTASPRPPVAVPRQRDFGERGYDTIRHPRRRSRARGSP